MAEMPRPPEFASLTSFPGHKRLLMSYFQNICDYKFLFACLTGHIVSPNKIRLLLAENMRTGIWGGQITALAVRGSQRKKDAQGRKGLLSIQQRC